MLNRITRKLDRVPGVRRAARLPRQVLRISPFAGDIQPVRVPLLSRRGGRSCLPFPHPWNYRDPLAILDAYFHGAEADAGPGRHNRYLEVPGFNPVLVTRDPGVIRAISAETGAKPGQFDRDTQPSIGIARATGRDTLLFANGEAWKHQKKLSTPPLARTTLFQPEPFHDFEQTFRQTVAGRLDLLKKHIDETGGPARVPLEPEIKPIMLELLVNNFFGGQISYEDIRNRYVPALERVIGHIISDTILNKLGVPLRFLPSVTRGIADAKQARADFEHLTDAALRGRAEGRGMWNHFTSDAPDAALRSNIRVFLAGALEATTSFASWAISHLARNPATQEKLFVEVANLDVYTPENLAGARYLAAVLDETLRLTPSLYFHPRRPTADTWITTTTGQRLLIPNHTHILLDIWHANRHEDHWGEHVTGHPALAFVPERWDSPELRARSTHDLLHFGFGHGPRFCPGKNLGQLEVALVVGACVKLLKFTAVNPDPGVRAGVSTKPADGTLVEVQLRPPAPGTPGTSGVSQSQPQACPFTARRDL